VSVFTILTLSGPVIGGAGFYFDQPVAFWFGVALAGVNLFMNLASGAIKLPLLPAACAIVGTLVLAPWYWGAGAGLLVWTALEGAGEFLPTDMWRRRNRWQMRHVPFTLGIIAIGLAVYLAVWVGGVLGITGATLLFAFGIPSLKTALFASDREIGELTNPDLSQKPSADTVNKFKDRV
jgi:hypothetical protein